MSNEPQEACRYFVTYSGVKLPFKLCQPLEEAAINNRNTFFQAWFDGHDRITSFRKMVYGEIELEHRYRYHEDGTLEQAEIVDAEGDATTLSFDRNGELIRP